MIKEFYWKNSRRRVSVMNETVIHYSQNLATQQISEN